MSRLAIANLTKRNVPDIPFAKLKEKILGPSYDLSLVFCGATLARQLNKTYRQKDKIANILSFPLKEKEGEIFIKLPIGEFSAVHLFIHGLLHLKGYQHGSKMDSEEKKILSLVKSNGQPQHHRRVRHRNRLGATRRLRT